MERNAWTLPKFVSFSLKEIHQMATVFEATIRKILNTFEEPSRLM
jgi:hypothetical protein